MRIERLDLADEGAVGACHEVAMAAQEADDPAGPRMSRGVFRGYLAAGWIGDPREVWLAREPDGAVAGWCVLELPDHENRERALLDLSVHPRFRRRGAGRALLLHAAGRAAAGGRRVLSGIAMRGGAGEAFAKAAGAESENVDVRRLLDLGRLPAGRAGELRAQAAASAAGYTLLSWEGPIPEDLLGQVGAVIMALGDAPRGTAEAEHWDAERVRERSNDVLATLGLRRHTIVARHDASGELAALTSVAVDPAIPCWGFQELTAVTRPHRGHRLGLLVKSAMLELLAQAEPQVDRILTSNAEANAHMIAVNDALGFEVFGPFSDWWLLPIA